MAQRRIAALSTLMPLASSALLFATLNGGVAAALGSLAPILVIPIQAVRDRQLARAKVEWATMTLATNTLMTESLDYAV